MPDHNLARPLTVLLADDDPTFRLFLRRVLSHFKVRVLEAVNGTDALRQIALDPPDLVVCDLDMPKPDGLMLARSLRANPDLRETPLVFVSGTGSMADVVQLKELGILDYLVKPLRVADAHARFERIFAMVAGRRS